MTNIYSNEPIRAKGLEHHLDATKAMHNGFGYSEFKRMVDSAVNVSNLARTFDVNRRTIDNWLEIYREEQTKGE